MGRPLSDYYECLRPCSNVTPLLATDAAASAVSPATIIPGSPSATLDTHEAFPRDPRAISGAVSINTRTNRTIALLSASK